VVGKVRLALALGKKMKGRWMIRGLKEDGPGD
jgi:hypothetical protein